MQITKVIFCVLGESNYENHNMFTIGIIIKNFFRFFYLSFLIWNDFYLDKIFGLWVPGTMSRNFLIVDISFKSRCNGGLKLVHSFSRNLYNCDLFRTDESKEEKCCSGKRDGWSKIKIKTIILMKINQ